MKIFWPNYKNNLELLYKMGNVSVKHKRSHRRGDMRSPLKDDISPRTIIRKNMRDSVTRRRKEAKANSDSPFGRPMLTKSRTKRNKTPSKETIMEEEEY